MRKIFQNREKGQSTIILALAFVFLLVVVGTTIDISVALFRQAAMQRAVDAAAVAASYSMCKEGSTQYLDTIAYQYVLLNGYGDKPEQMSLVVVTQPPDTPVPTIEPSPTWTPSPTPEGEEHPTATPMPTSTPMPSPDQYVEVTLHRDAPLVFLSLVLPQDHIRLTVRAVAACNELRVRIAE